MLTSPLNVTIANPHGASLKPQALNADTGPGHSPALAARAGHDHEPALPELESPNHSALTTVSAGAATIASRTVLQDLVLRIANLLQMSRGSDENLTALFIRVIAAIEGMNQAERLQFEIRSGLKALRITLTDLANALRNPDGAEAARLTAMAEAPLAAPGRTAANSATTTYLEEGTANGHAEETLAMRAAARSNAAGLGLFSAETRPRADLPPADAKGLQSQLRTLFEPGASERDVHADATPHGDTASEPKHAAPPTATARADGTAPRVANLKIDPQTAEKLHAMAIEVAKEGQEFQHRHPDAKPADKPGAGDHRLQTMLTLKGLAEVVASLPGKAAELFAMPPDAMRAEAAVVPNPARPEMAAEVRISEGPMEISLPENETPPDQTTAAADFEGEAVDAAKDDALPGTPRKPIATTDADPRPTAEQAVPGARPGAVHQGVPFAYAVLQPAREEFAPEIDEADARERDDRDEDRDEDAEDGESRRPRDEYDEMRDPQPEEKPAIVINRDSTEAERAFALYQRMGGF